MNDDHDLDARLRAAARAFPAASAPDRTRLRHVVTTSRRRSRRSQGSVLACATAVVAAGAVLAVREPRSTESVEVAASTTTEPSPTPWGWATDIRERICPPDLPAELQDLPSAYVLQLMTTDGSPLPNLTVRIDDKVFWTNDPTAAPSPPAFDLQSAIEFAPGPDDGRVVWIVSPYEPEEHTISITADGTAVAAVPARGDVSLDGSMPPPGMLRLDTGPLDAICATTPATDPEPGTTGPPAPTTSVLQTAPPTTRSDRVR